ncbi:hypothetical protein [Micromonospora sp. WMMD736]|uniref:hypothetical protein n=1 Tax=Micromonospora sp. WMMD736 TaxID=3404112 RepID=UPI003B925078
MTAITGCGVGDDLTAPMRMPTSDSAVAGAGDELTVTARQREYLDALRAAGLQPSSDLLALTIGSYVCQAHAAEQSEQAVWSFVAPLVRSDVGASDPSPAEPPSARIQSPPAARSDSRAVDAHAPATTGVATPPADDVDRATADYIRIATDRLC